MEGKRVRDSSVVMAQMMIPQDANPAGNVHGGVVVKLIDEAAHAATLTAIKDKVPIIYQAALQDGVFAGFADFLILDGAGKHEVWDTKLALSPKPYYPIQLCCYSEMLAASTGQGMPERIGVILGNEEHVQRCRRADRGVAADVAQHGHLPEDFPCL